MAASVSWSPRLRSFIDLATAMPPMQSAANAMAVFSRGCRLFFTSRSRSVTIAEAIRLYGTNSMPPNPFFPVPCSG